METMRVISFIALLFIMPFIASSQVLYNEDFNLPDGTTTDAGATAWTSSYSGGGYFATTGDSFFIYNLDSEGVWTSQSIDISGYGYAVIDIAGYVYYANTGDYLRFYYSVDGGPEVLFGDFSDGFFTGAVGASSIVSGSSLVITVRAFNTTFLESYLFDDVVVTGITTLYSRKSGDWTDATAGTGTWSVVSHLGAACTCIPNSLTLALIGDGHTVDMNADGTTGGVEINSGTLRYTAANVDLNIVRDYYVQLSSGTVDRNGQSNARINFSGGAIATINMDGPLTIDDIDILSASTLTLSGNGAVSVNDDFYFSDAATITNNKTNTFAVTDRIMFSSGGASFTNNQSLTAGSLYFDSDGSDVTNNSTMTLTSGIFANDNGDDDNVVTNASGATLSVGAINPTNADMDVLNYGTINQSGNFTNINTTDTNFDNLSTGVWNWSLTPNTTYDTDIATVLNLTAVGNTFNYNAAGDQRIIPTTYHHISLSTSGAKAGNNASFSVQGNWTVSGTATFTEGTAGTITFNGSVAQTITNPAGETFYNLTINNSYGASPQITTDGNVTVSNVLTMTDGNVNLNGNTFRIASSAVGALSHSLASTAGWMYGGSFARVRPASTTITVGASAHSLFPLGSSSDWRPFFVGQNSVAGTAGTMTVTHTNSTSTSTVSFAESIVRRHDSYWTPTTTGTGGTYTLRAGGTNFGTIQETADLRMSTSTGVVGTHAAASGGPTDWRVNRTAVSLAQLNSNNFHVASTDATNSPLPIELISFTAKLVNSEVELEWSTASELNNDYFTIERATDVEHFEAILEEDGMGTTKELNHYKVIDASPLYGKSYYRLKQTDFDGQYSYSPVQVILYEGPRFATLTAFPNPLEGSDLTIRIEGLQGATHVPVQILNMQGQKVYEKVIEVGSPGIIMEEISANYFLTSGLYIIKAGETLYLTKKIVVE